MSPPEQQRRSVARLRPGRWPRDRAAASETPGRPREPARAQARASTVFASAPICVGAHPGTQPGESFDRVRPNLKGAQIEVAGCSRCTPTRVLTLGGYEPDFDCNWSVAERGDAHVESIANFQAARKILSQVKAQPHVA